MKIEHLQGMHLVIFGLGVEGQAALEVLSTKLPGAAIDVFDEGNDRSTITKEAFLELASDQVVIIRSPGVSYSNEVLRACIDKGALVTTGVNIFLAERKGRGKIIGITGSKGKSTTASLLAHILKAAGVSVQLVGNIGEPAIKYLDEPDETVFVVELSSYMLEDMTMGPNIGVLLNIFVAHVEHHEGFDAYKKAKLRLFEVQEEGDLGMYLPGALEDDDLAKVSAQVSVLESTEDDAAIREHLTLPGEHFVKNARLVLAICRELGVPDQVSLATMKVFEPLPHRLEDVGTYKGIIFINDSISTLPDAAVAAIDAFEDRLGVIILGGQDEGYDFAPLAERLAGLQKGVVYILPGGARLKELLNEKGVAYAPVDTVEDAVQKAYEELSEGTVCLLSPASPSFDQFASYKQRGELFAGWARQYGES